jgi:hypothetical protein
VKKFALDPIVSVGMELPQWQQQKHPYEVCGNTINVIDYHKEYPENGSRIFDDVSANDK